MSLINEALKKAQKDGNGKDAPASRSPDVSSATLNNRKTGGVAIAVGVVAILAVAGGAGYYFMQDEPSAVTPTLPVQKVEDKPVAEVTPVAKPVEPPVAPSAQAPETKPAETPPVGETVKPAEPTANVVEPAVVKPAEAPVAAVVPVKPVFRYY